MKFRTMNAGLCMLSALALQACTTMGTAVTNTSREPASVGLDLDIKSYSHGQSPHGSESLITLISEVKDGLRDYYAWKHAGDFNPNNSGTGTKACKKSTKGNEVYNRFENDIEFVELDLSVKAVKEGNIGISPVDIGVFELEAGGTKSKSNASKFKMKLHGDSDFSKNDLTPEDILNANTLETDLGNLLATIHASIVNRSSTPPCFDRISDVSVTATIESSGKGALKLGFLGLGGGGDLSKTNSSTITVKFAK